MAILPQVQNSPKPNLTQTLSLILIPTLALTQTPAQTEEKHYGSLPLDAK